MPRKNQNVRTRNTPRAAQKQRKRHDTFSTQFDAREHRGSRHVPLGSLEQDPENAYTAYLSDQLDEY